MQLLVVKLKKLSLIGFHTDNVFSERHMMVPLVMWPKLERDLKPNTNGEKIAEACAAVYGSIMNPF
jgi:hypothetical protein